MKKPDPAAVADQLAALYERPFGSKPKGRYRIARKLVGKLAGRRRLYEDDVRSLARELLERGCASMNLLCGRA